MPASVGTPAHPPASAGRWGRRGREPACPTAWASGSCRPGSCRRSPPPASPRTSRPSPGAVSSRRGPVDFVADLGEVVDRPASVRPSQRRMMNLSPSWMMPESSPGFRANASSSNCGWPPCLLMGGISPRSSGCPARRSTGRPGRRSARPCCSSAPPRRPAAPAAACPARWPGSGPAARSSPRSPCGGLLRSPGLALDELLQRRDRPDHVVAVDIQGDVLASR